MALPPDRLPEPPPLGDPDATAAVAAGLANVIVPLPGAGATLARWRALAAVGGYDLGVAKLAESHWDAGAILAELGAPPPLPGSRWAVWAAEGAEPVRLSGGRLTGHKAWCSGAATVTWALVSCRDDDDRRCLAAVELAAPRVAVHRVAWASAGMRGAATGAVEFTGTPARQVGPPGGYLERPGFAHGGAGIAAVWHGATVALARRLPARDQLGAALRGGLDVTLSASRELLRAAAAGIDASPTADASVTALRVRAATEAAARATLDLLGRVLGPAPLAGDPAFAQRCADLAVFIRQSHADWDLAALGGTAQEDTWLL